MYKKTIEKKLVNIIKKAGVAKGISKTLASLLKRLNQLQYQHVMVKFQRLQRLNLVTDSSRLKCNNNSYSQKW